MRERAATETEPLTFDLPHQELTFCTLLRTLAAFVSLPFCTHTHTHTHTHQSSKVKPSQSCSYSEEERGALWKENHAECCRETGERAQDHVDPPRLYRHAAQLRVDGGVKVTNHNPGQKGGEDGAEDPEGSQDDDERPSTTPREELTEI